jgi:trans-2,3-dihydro-3-hydroxyanthranilate isomerase
VPRAYLHYDVFTGQPFLGNQLAVFTDARGLDTATMQRIAREMNFSESTFILPAEQPGTDVRMRIFAPSIEMPMAGHPTIGSTFALAETGVIRPGSSRFVFGLNVGPVPVDLEWAGDRLRFAWMTQANPTFEAVVDNREVVASALGLTGVDLADLPIQPVSCGVPFLFVPLRDAATVDRAISDAAAMRRMAEAVGFTGGLFLFAVNDAADASRPARVHSRMFAPELGITEDPATGGASGPLGCYLVQHGVVAPAFPASIESMQGVVMGRASRIHIAITGRPGAITEVKVGGESVLVGRGELLV